MLWGASAEAAMILRLQKKAIRILCGLGHQQSCREFFRREDILTIPSVYILNYVDHIHRHAQSYQRNSYVHGYSTKNRDALKIPFHRLEKTQRNTDFLGVKLYNKLPNELKQKSPRTFKTHVKSLLLRHSFYSSTAWSVDEYLTCDMD